MMLMECGVQPQEQWTVFRERKRTNEFEEFRKKSNTGSSGKSDKWRGRRDNGPQFELRCCVDQDKLLSNVDRQYFFEDEQVRTNGSVFNKRTDYANLLSVIPMSKFNGIHIKMEDDCPQGGDDVRICVLKSLGAHNQRAVSCVACSKNLPVYDKYPLIDGTFFVSPIARNENKTEIMVDGRKFFLQQLCADCLWAKWGCNNCNKQDWFNGKSFILGTLYYYDILSTSLCCSSRCYRCKKTLPIRDQLYAQLANGNYLVVNEMITCDGCGCHDYHLTRNLKDCVIRKE